MTVDEAFSLIDKYGGVCGTIGQLKADRPTESELENVKRTMLYRGVSTELSNEAIKLVKEHHASK